MLPVKILYALLLAVLYMFSILYLPEFSVYILITMLTLPVFLFVSVRLRSRRLHIHLELPSAPVYCGEVFQCRLIFENPLPLPLSTANALLSVKHLTLLQEISDSVSTAVPARGKASVTIPIRAVHGGRMQIAVSRAGILDAFRLFRGRCKKMPQAYCTILPKLPSPPRTPLFVAEADKEMRPTESPEEFLGVREYRSGDRLRAVHWKLSSRVPEPVVREYGEPLLRPASIALLYSLSDPQAADAGARLDAMLEAVLALGMAVCSSGRPLRLMICFADRFEVHTAETAADMIPMLCQLLQTPPTDACDNCCDQLQRYGRGVGFCVADAFPCPPAHMIVFSATSPSVGQNVFPISAGTAADIVYRQLAAAGGDS